MAGQNTEYTAKKTIQSTMLPHTARWENYNTEKEDKGRQEQKGRLEGHKRDKMRSNGSHTALNIANLSLPPSFPCLHLSL